MNYNHHITYIYLVMMSYNVLMNGYNHICPQNI